MTKLFSKSGSTPEIALVAGLTLCPTERWQRFSSSCSTAHSPAFSGSLPSVSFGLEIWPGRLMSVTVVSPFSPRSLPSICQTGSASLTPGRARIASRSPSSISMVEATSRSHSPKPLKKFSESFFSVSAE